MTTLQPKVAAAGSGAGASALLMFAVEHYVFADRAPALVDLALQVLVPALVALAAGWLKREEIVVYEPVQVPASAIHTRPADVPSLRSAAGIPLTQAEVDAITARFERERHGSVRYLPKDDPETPPTS